MNPARSEPDRPGEGRAAAPGVLDPASPAARALAWQGAAAPRGVAVLGSSGTVGLGALDIVRANPEAFRVVALAAGRRMQVLAEQVREFRPLRVAVADDAARDELAGLTDLPRPAILAGPDALAECAAAPADVVLNAVTGAAGLPATLGAIGAGRALALANKESLVLAGELVFSRARDTGTPILPVDSEHAGLFQCLAGLGAGGARDVRRFILTASGGPLLRRADWADATPEEVLAHPIWKMGARITVDSSLLLNKGFEVIEAHWLFGAPLAAVDVVVHPQAIVHALVETVDHSLLAQLSLPDMKLPIQLALAWPARLPAPLPALDLAAAGRLDFLPLTPGRFPAYDLVRRAAERGGTAPALVNAADEVAVQAFLEGAIRLGEVPEVIAEVLDTCPVEPATSLGAISQADRAGREAAVAWLRRRGVALPVAGRDGGR